MPDDEERQEPQSEALGQDGDNSLDPAGDDFIEDSTPEDQLEREADLLANKQIDDDGDPADRDDADEPDDRPLDEETPAPESDETPATSEAEETPPEEPEAPQPKYTDEDVERIRREVQSARDREVEQKLQAYQQQLDKFNMDAAVEAYLRQMRDRLVETGRFDVDEAQEQVFTEANREQARREYQQNQYLQQLQQQQQFQQYDTAQREAYKLLGDRITDMQKKLSLPKEDVEMLLQQVPERFESQDHFYRFEQALTNQALSLYKRRGRSRVPNGAPDRQPTSGRSSGASETKDQRALRIMEKPSWEWTKEDHAAMKDSLR